ncbi:MAG TPA: hypothetical protein VK766_10325 [Cytophagaceae bacterium]|jgi:hypothetical protein|nr:hypothetical protein [Cytophagaceae bacterium]
MKELHKNWLTQGLIDFEYKKYLLLGYLQGVKEEFNSRKLYPVFTDLLFHYKNIIHLKQNKDHLYENFPKEISGADFEKLSLMYTEIVKDDKIMKELEDIMEYAIMVFQNYLTEGKDIYEEIEYNMSIAPVGLFSLNYDKGYMFFYVDNMRQAKVYEYEMTIFESSEEKYRGIHTNFLETVDKGLNNTFESIKIYLVKKYKKMTNPATYLVDSKVNYPFDEAILPIAKRMLVRYINNQAA